MNRSLFDEADTLRDRLTGLRPLSAAELERLRDEFMVENTYNSNAIEGNTLTLRETALILREGVTVAGKSLKDHLEAVGHRDAFEYVVSVASPDLPLTERRVKEIHTLVLLHDALHKGVYRNVQVTILGAVHTPPQPYLIAPRMEALIGDYDGLKRGRHIIEAIAEFHLRFEDIHPFIDGNGRTGRLIMNLELIKAGYLPIDIKFADRDKYYACFDAYYAADRRPDALAELILGYEIRELERYIGIVAAVGRAP